MAKERNIFEFPETFKVSCLIKSPKQLFVMKGKEYKSSTDYYSRPWEKEARSAQFELWKEFKKLYYKNE